MKIKSTATVRFAKLVEESGRPEQAILWTAPGKDPAFQKAVKEHRVATVVQRNVGTKADYGLIGFFERKKASYLIFPKRLEVEPETKVIGIKYDQIEEGAPKGPLFEPGGAGKRKGKSKAAPGQSGAAAKADRSRRFVAEVEVIARQTVTVEVEAGSIAEAKKVLKLKVESLEIDLEKAKVARKVRFVRSQ